VKNQDAPDLLSSCMGHDADFRMAWDFMVTNWTKIVDTYPQSGTVRLCRSVTALDTPEMEEEVKAFFAKTKVDAGTMAIAQALESLRINVSLRQRESERLSDYVNPKPPAPPAAPAAPSTDGSAK
jgi:hypothetical protein